MCISDLNLKNTKSARKGRADVSDVKSLSYSTISGFELEVILIQLFICIVLLLY